ncbi:MAG: hypothetical protein AAGA75_17085 [Cyanobacteria bacterium P01_E01_bin.6]
MSKLFNRHLVVQESDFYGNCPVQAEITSDGLYFYFRSRGRYASLDIYDFEGIPDDLPGDDLLLYSGGLNSWQWTGAGSISRNEALYAFYLLWSDAKGAIA